MKLFYILFLFIFNTVGCKSNYSNEPQKAQIYLNQQFVSYVYTAQSRGYFKQITLKNYQLFVANSSSEVIGKEIKVSKKDLKFLYDEIKKVNLNKFQTLIGKQQNRFHDGAAHANLSITNGTDTNETQGFDAGDPPIEIKKFVNKLIQLAK